MDDRAADIIALADRLDAPEPLDWDEIEELVADFPGWLRLVQHLRYPSKSQATLIVQMGEPTQSTFVSGEKRQELRAFFRPYALLLDARCTPPQKVALLQKAGIDVPRFCTEHLQNGVAEITTAARQVLEAYEADATLLRGASALPAGTEELLRAAQPGASPGMEGLLQPAEPVVMPATPPVEAGWLQRLRAKFRRRT
jgi:hypothetical protein